MRNSSPTGESHRSANPSIRVRLLLGLLILVSCVGFLAADVVTIKLFEEPISALIILGVVTAQLTVICVWGTLVRGTFWIRLPWTLLLLVVSWCAFVWGMHLHRDSVQSNQMLGIGLLWLFGFVTSFVPLKIAAICFRWQIVYTSSGDPGKKKVGYAIRDIMIGTLLLALTMGIARNVWPLEDDASLMGALYESGLGDGEALFLISLYGIISLLVKLPCIWVSLGAATKNIPHYIFVWAIYCLGLAILEITLILTILGAGPGDQMAALSVGIILSHQLMGAIMLAVCLALRGLGYRLERSANSVATATTNPE